MALSLTKIEALAPDQGSLAAAKKLLKPSGWPTVCEDGEGLVWGECQGSGSNPYRVCVTEADAGYKCTCPSRKFPCKHSLALMWMRVEGKVAFSKGTAPGWVSDWLSRRRGPSSAGASTEPKASIAATEVEVAAEVVDPKAEAKAAAARERGRQSRETAILGGLDELSLWLSDMVAAGVATFASNPGPACRMMAQRLFDAKASGLGVLVDSLPSRILALPEFSRAVACVKELGGIHLVAEAYRRQTELPERLKDDVRQMVGWNITRETLLADESAERAETTWRVWLTRAELQPDKLRRIETWLHGDGRNAVLIDYVPASTGAAKSGYAVGEQFSSELVFYPSPVPMRALISRATSGCDLSDDPLSIPEIDLGAAFGQYEEALALKPWLGDYPLFFRNGRIKRSAGRFYLVDNNVCLPVSDAQADAAWPLLQCGNIAGAGIWNGEFMSLSWLETDLGRWMA
ncbi:SWIM zinc finger domain-containing protein [Agrobacterium salinitolerans]|nr:SWIM zinc finger domain-containing protein [Agrobacterium salinitolerans]